MIFTSNSNCILNKLSTDLIILFAKLRISLLSASPKFTKIRL